LVETAVVAEVIKMDASVAVKKPISFYVSLTFGSLFLFFLLPCLFMNERMEVGAREWLSESTENCASLDLDDEYCDPANYA